MTTCPYCSTNVDDEFNFCTNCEMQVKCTKCGHPLLMSKTKCLVCGTLVVDHSTPQFRLNEYSFDEEGDRNFYKRQIHLKFSDIAIEKAGKLLPGYIFPIPSNQIREVRDNEITPELASLTESDGETFVDKHEITESGGELLEEIRDSKDSYSEIEKWIFRHGDNLEIKLRDFKGKTKKEQQRRLVLLFVWAYRRFFDQPVKSRTPILAIAKGKHIWDTSFSNLITNMQQDLIIEDEEGIVLSPTGESEIDTILSELLDDSLDPGYDYWTTKTSTRKSVKSAKTKADTEMIKSLVDTWLAADIDLGDFDVRKMANVKARQKVQFGLWVLKNKLNVNQAPLQAVIQFITRKFPTMGGKEKSLINSVAVKEYVGRTPQNECFLTPKGEDDVEALLPISLKD